MCTHSIVGSVICILQTMQCTADYSISASSVYTVQRHVYIAVHVYIVVHCTMYNVQCTLCTGCTVYTVCTQDNAAVECQGQQAIKAKIWAGKEKVLTYALLSASKVPTDALKPVQNLHLSTLGFRKCLTRFSNEYWINFSSWTCECFNKQIFRSHFQIG